MQKITQQNRGTKNFNGIASKKIFEIMFVRHDEDQSVEIVESATIDFNAIIENLGEGNSIFIAPKIRESLPLKKKLQNQNYFDHV